jgi:hypothetical protein
MSSEISSMFYGAVLHQSMSSEVLLAVEFVEVLRAKFAENGTGTKAFLLVSVLLRMFDIFLCLSSLNVE